LSRKGRVGSTPSPGTRRWHTLPSSSLFATSFQTVPLSRGLAIVCPAGSTFERDVVSTEPAAAAQPDALLQRYQALLDLSDLIHACHDPDELFKKLAAMLRRVVAYDAIAVGLLDEQKQSIRLSLLESWVTPNVQAGFTMPLRVAPAGWVVEHQKVLRLRLQDNDARYPFHNEGMRQSGVQVSFHFPLTTALGPLGVLLLAFKQDIDLPENELQFLQRAANQVAVAIESAGHFENARSAHRSLEQVNQQREALLQRYQTLVDASDVIHGCQDLDELFKKLAEVMRRVVAYDAIAIGLLDAHKENVRIALIESWVAQSAKVGFEVPLREIPAGWVVQHQRPLRVVTGENDPRFPVHNQAMRESGFAVSFHLPLSTPAAPLGEMIFAFREVAEVPDSELEFMQRIADQVALAIENAGNFAEARRAQREVEHRNQQRGALLKLTNNIVTQLDLQEVLRTAVQSVRQVVPCALSAVALPEGDGQNLRIMTIEFPGGQGLLREGLLLPVNGSHVGRVFQTSEAYVINAPLAENYSPALYKTIVAEGLRAQCFVPLISRGRPLGVLGMSRTEEGVFTTDEMEFLKHVAGQISIALENALQFDQLREAEREMARERDRSQLLLEVNNAVVSHLDLGELLSSISSSLRRVVPHDGAYFSIVNGEGTHLEGLALDQRFTGDDILPGRKLESAGTPEGEAIATRRPVLVGSVNLQRFPSPLVQRGYARGIRSGCTVPLIAHDRALGALSVVSGREHAFTEEDAVLLGQCSSQIAIAVENALAYREITALKDRLAQEKLYLEDEIRAETHFDEIIGQSSTLREVLRLVETVATTDSTVLLLGETGTGKELIARAVHQRSRRTTRTFVKLNCAAIPTGLLESELFGHERGAFTGAIAQKIGRLELADQGTLFLDEVGDIPVEIQPKLLRALQEREFERLGSTHTKKVNVRLVAATNRDLEKMIADREFRSDLYYRLNVFPIRIPPLRDRSEDIPLLVRYFVQKYSRQMQKPIQTVPTEAMNRLERWHWPGNVRELENFIERAVILTNGSALHVPVSEIDAPAPPRVSTGAPKTETSPALNASSLVAKERDHILQVLRETKWVLAGPAGAAARLGLKRTTLQSKMKKLGINREAQ